MKIYTVLCEFDGLPLRHFACKWDAEKFAAGRKIIVTAQKRVTRKQAVLAMLAEIEGAPF